MEDTLQESGWVYVFVCNPGSDEHFLGLYDKAKDVNFIPAFQSKDDANDCFLSLPREKGKKYEVQAIHIEELSATATENGFIAALVDKDGNILK